MTRAVFIAADPHRRAQNEEKLRDLIAEIRGVKDWRVDSKGEVTVDYDHRQTSSNIVEEALAGVGYQIKHVQDDARLGRVDQPNYGVSEVNTGGKKYGQGHVETTDRARQTKHKKAR